MFPSGSEILVIVLAVLVLFGGKKIPEIARYIGKGINELQKATRDIKREMDINQTDREAEKKKDDLKG
jgi:sec-independent protein translocase protein TatA